MYFSLYKTMYNINICFCYTRRCIMKIFICYYIREIYNDNKHFSLYMKVYFSLYSMTEINIFASVIRSDVQWQYLFFII